MAINEYVIKINQEIRNNPKSYIQIIEEASATLEESNVSSDAKKEFWKNLAQALDDSGKPILLVNSQDSSQLWELVMAAQNAALKKSKEVK